MLEDEDIKKALTRSVDIVGTALSAVQNKFSERQFYLNMYHSYDAILKEKAWWQTKFAHPFPFFTIEMKTSFCEEGIFGTSGEGLFQAKAWSYDSQKSAEKLTKLLQYQEDQSDLHKEFYLGAKSLFIHGDWFLETFWDVEEIVYQEKERYMMGIDQTISTPVFQKVPGQMKKMYTKNQPNVQTLNPNSIWPDPKAISLEKARYFCIRKEYTFNQLKEMERKGLFINVDKLKGTAVPKLPSSYYDIEPYSPFIKSGNSQKATRNSPIDTENQIVEVVHIIYPDTGEWESIGNRTVYLGRMIKYRYLKNPLTQIKNFEEKDKMFGMSDFLSIANHWRLINQYQCLEADNILAHHRGYTMISRDAGPNVQEQIENLRPGSVIVTNNLGAISHNRPDLFSPLVLQSKQDLIAQAQQPMGLNEILQGATPSSNVRSSEQFSQLANFGAKLLSQSIRNIQAGLEKVGMKWVALNYEFLDPDYSVPITDADGMVIEDLNMGYGDLAPWAPITVKLNADLQAQKNIKVQQMMQGLNSVMNVPGVAVPTMIKDMLKFQGSWPNVDKYFLLNDEQTAQILLQQLGIGQPTPQNPAVAGQTRPPSPNQVAAGNQSGGTSSVPSP